jgi:hypothetical protein
MADDVLKPRHKGLPIRATGTWRAGAFGLRLRFKGHFTLYCGLLRDTERQTLQSLDTFRLNSCAFAEGEVVEDTFEMLL